MHLLMNLATGAFARPDCQHEGDGRFTTDAEAARKFEAFGEAVDFSKWFGIDWHPIEFADMAADHPALRHLRVKH
jgi:hypothetical protein